MINLLPGSNAVILTLSELRTSPGYDYIFKFSNTGTDVYFSQANTSSYDRYDEFEVTVNDGVDLLNGKIELDIPGLWNYTVYEKLSPIQLSDLTAAVVANLTIVEQGKMIYNGRTISSATNEVTITKKIYHK